MNWKSLLIDQIPENLANEIETFENQIELRRQGKIEEKVFAETRLRRGVYGQRYDNGQRNDGTGTKHLPYPQNTSTKGPDTIWDAPGMQRIKIPFGGITPEQMDLLADVSEEYSDAVLHVTTRQDFQLHFVHIDDTPSLMRRLASVGITTREACGNSVRNVTACPLAGICRDETFDVTPYAKACAKFLLGHPDAQNFGRKFKVAFSGCQEHACGLVNMHDMGAVGIVRRENGTEQHGFALYIGGGLGAVPHQAQLFDPFLPVEELLSTAQAISRVFARLGEKEIRSRARIKFLVAKLGIEEFRRLVLEERKTLPKDPNWTEHISKTDQDQETPLRPASSLSESELPQDFRWWYATNVYSQRQTGYATVTIALPLGDLSASQMRQLADLARRFTGDNVRNTVEQNIVFRWISESYLPELYGELKKIGLAASGAGTIADVTACPGTDTCKLGIASSRGLAAEIRKRVEPELFKMGKAVRDLRIKISGCFNSCGQHHIADIGFYGTSRTIDSRKVPHFQVVLGGRWVENGGSYGLAIGSVPAKQVPEALQRITDQYVKESQEGQTFQDFVQSVGKRALRKSIEDLMQIQSYKEAPSFYSDWGDPREFTIGDMAMGECAGEVVTLVQFELAEAERQVFESQLKLDEADYGAADALGYSAMLQAAKALIRIEFLDVPADPNTIVNEFRTRFFDTRLFHDKYAGEKFAQYFFHRHANPPERHTSDSAHRLVEETQLFIEAAYRCWEKTAARQASTSPVSSSSHL